jgi:GNAT superfamily N-acetyltransferase
VHTGHATVDQPAEGTPVTASGAHLGVIDPEVAAGFLARLGELGPEPIEVAMGAREDDGTLIGVAVLGPSTRQRAWATVAVTPARRRLNVGSDLLGALLRQAGTRDLRYLASSQPTAAAGTALVRSMGLITARRVHRGVATLVVILAPQR